MYRHSKIGSGVIVDLGSTTKTLSSIDTTGKVTVINPSANSNIMSSETFTFSGYQAVTSSVVRIGSLLPHISRDESITASFSGHMSVYGIESSSAINSMQIIPFVASEGSTPWSGQASETIANIKYLPLMSKYTNTASVNILLVLADLGYGMDLYNKGVAIGFEVRCQGSETVFSADGTVNIGYNYSPIKTLDMEV